MPTAKVRRATAVNRGARPRLRKTCQSWTLTHPIGSPSRLMWPSRGPEPVWRAYPSNIITSARLLKFEECSQRHRFELVTVMGARLTYSRQRRVFHLDTLCVILWGRRHWRKNRVIRILQAARKVNVRDSKRVVSDPENMRCWSTGDRTGMDTLSFARFRSKCACS